jgi:hypothetical protein
MNIIEIDIPKGFNYYLNKLVIEMVIEPGDGPALMQLISGRNVPFSMRLCKQNNAWILSCGIYIKHKSNGLSKKEWLYTDTEAVIPNNKISGIGMAFNGESLMLLVNNKPMTQKIIGKANLATEYNANQQLIIGSKIRRQFVGKLLGFRVSEMPRMVETAYKRNKGHYAIISKYNSLSSLIIDVLGSPKTNTPKQYSKYCVWRFAKGAIYWSEETGANLVSSAFYNIYKLTKYSKALGFPCNDKVQNGGLYSQRFRNGTTYYSPYITGGPGLLWDEVFNAYMALGGTRSFLGLPLGLPEGTNANPGICTIFQHGRIYWSPNSGAFEVHGRILNRYLTLNGPNGILGFPVSNESLIYNSGNTEIGRMSIFEKGIIYWSPKTDAWEMTGPILEKYKSLGGPSGKPGFPITGIFNASNNTARCSGCEKGVIWWSGDTKVEPRVISELKLTLFKAEHNVKQPFSDELSSGAPNLYSNVFYLPPFSEPLFQRTWPTDINSAKENIIYDDNFKWDIPIRHDTTFSLNIHFWDRDVYDAPDPLGSLIKEFNVNNYWGLANDDGYWPNTPLTEKTSFVGTKDTILTSFKMKPKDDLIDITPNNFRSLAFWKFINPKTKKISYAQYSTVFNDVAPGLNLWEGLQKAYYELLIKKSAAPGNCFGMSLEALNALLGTSFFSQPIYNRSWEKAEDTINRAHIYQLGAPMVSYLFQLLLSNRIEPKNVFDAAKQQIDLFGACVVSMFKIASLEGHSVLAYKAEKSPGRGVYGKLYVADPNTPWNSGDLSHASYIEIKGNNTWTGPGNYSCDVSDPILLPPTLLIYYPLPVMSIAPWTPLNELFVFALSTIFILMGDADTKQLRVGNKKMFQENQGRLIRDGIPNMTIVPVNIDGRAPFIVAGKDQLFGEMKIEVTGKKDGKYQAFFKSPGSTVHLRSPIKKATEDAITVFESGGTINKVALKTTQNQKIGRLTVEILDSLITKDRHIFHLDLPLAGNQEVLIQVEPLSGALVLSGTEPTNQINVEIEQVIGGRSHSKKVQNFRCPSGDEVVRVRLIDRSSLNSPMIVERLSNNGDVLEQRINQ